MKRCKICEKESQDNVGKCEHCSAPFDLSQKEVEEINRFFQTLVEKREGERGLRGIRKDEAYFLYKMAPQVLGNHIMEI